MNIGTPWLGLPKVFSAIFSGEMKDTAELAPWMDYWRQKVVVSQADVLNIMRTFRSLPSMFPRGGNIVWGDSEGAPDDAVEGEDQLDELIPTKDYPGGEGQRFMTSQATAALRDDKYDDPNRISEAKERESHANEPLPNARDEVADPTGVTRSPHSYLGQFVSFTDDVPWPFPNITQIVDDAMKEIAQAEKEEGERPATEVGGRRRPSKTSKAWTKKLRQSVLKNGSTSALRELNIEDSIVLLKQLAWSDMEFNEELYTYGFGAKDERMTAHPANATTPIDLIDIDPASPDNVLDEAVRWVNPLETALPMAPHMKICQSSDQGGRRRLAALVARFSFLSFCACPFVLPQIACTASVVRASAATCTRMPPPFRRCPRSPTCWSPSRRRTSAWPDRRRMCRANQAKE